MPSYLIMGEIDISPLLKAQKMLQEGIREATSPLEKTGAIQRFEFSYKLAWKTMRRILIKQGIETNSPRETFRFAGTNNLIDDVEFWFEAIRKRNLTVHTYDQEYADEIFAWLPLFQKHFDVFIEKIKTRT